MWRCVCGHAFYSALPPSCPTCSRAVDADAEETVSVGGRKLPFHVWEAEVLVRAVACCAMLHGGGLLAGAIVSVGARSIGALAPALLGGVLLFAAIDAARRGWVSRWLLLSASVLTLPGLLCTGLAVRSATRDFDPALVVPWLASEVAIALFTLYVVLSTGGDWVWEWGSRGEPIARLSSAWKVNRSIKTWASAAMVFLTSISVALFLMMLLGVSLSGA